MQINLKQYEIEVALKNYVAQQGISLYARDVSITFTAGRKESGISAEITIEDSDIPGFGHGEIYLVPPSVPECLMKSDESITAVANFGNQELGKDETVVVTTATVDAGGEVSVVIEKGSPEVTVQPEDRTESAKPVSLFG